MGCVKRENGASYSSQFIPHSKYQGMPVTMTLHWQAKQCIFSKLRKHECREENQLDATERSIAHIICSTCFGHLYAHHQELETILVLLPCIVCNALVAGGRLSRAELQAMRPGWGKLCEITTWSAALCLSVVHIFWPTSYLQMIPRYKIGIKDADVNLLGLFFYEPSRCDVVLTKLSFGQNTTIYSLIM